MATRTRLGPEARRQQLLDIGIAMVADGDVATVDDLRMDDVAGRAGVSKALLFHYFPAKRDFAVAVARAAAADLLTRTDLAPTDDLIDGLRASVSAFVEYVEGRRDAYVGLVRGSAKGDAAMRAVYDETRDAITRRTLDALERGGLPHDDVVALAVRAWQAFVEEAVIAWLDDPRISRDRMLDLLVQSFLAIVGSTQSDP
ncbi:MAG: TetR/AcrR family transcriptional regulator [Nocardioidaceae bacterium]